MLPSRIAVVLSSALALALLCGCGPSPYGHGRVYEPLAPEGAALEGAEPYDPVMARRQPELWRAKKLTLFGVVVKRDDRGVGQGYITLSVRTLEGRNLCSDASEDSCRTTVSEREHDRLHVSLRFATGADEAGRDSVGVGSLLRVVGSLAATVDADDGAQVIEAAYYRHWPRGYYVTTAASGTMRR